MTRFHPRPPGAADITVASGMPSRPTPRAPDDGQIDPHIACGQCDAVCCRLTVVLDEYDRVAAHLTTFDDAGLHVMARDDEGWCVAVDSAQMRCSIYESRPAVCRRFVMGAVYCQAVREDYAMPRRDPIALTLCKGPP